MAGSRIVGTGQHATSTSGLILIPPPNSSVVSNCLTTPDLHSKPRMKRFELRDRIHTLDAEDDCEEITRILTTQEFPWDMTQALGLALYRTYAVPSFGELLAKTHEFTERTQRRYDDTALVLNDIMEHGFGPGRGRAAGSR